VEQCRRLFNECEVVEKEGQHVLKISSMSKGIAGKEKEKKKEFQT